MGNSRFDPGAYQGYSRSVASKSAAQIFTNTTGCHADLDPAKIKVRESVDSIANPDSTPIMIGVDVTGSMGILAENIVKTGLGVVVNGIYDRKPVTDPHILLAAIGDAYTDQAPFQATQFEADVALVKQIEKIFIEGNGGGNGGESYPLMWWFAANKTKCDCIDKRAMKGYLFTVGDEAPHPTLTRDCIKRVFDATPEADIDVRALLEEISANWNVFHLIVPTDATQSQDAVKKWRELLGERAVEVTDHTKLGEIIVSIMQVNEGHDINAAASGWDNSTALMVRNATSGIVKGSRNIAVETV